MIFAGNIARQPAYVGHPLIRAAGGLAGAQGLSPPAPVGLVMPMRKVAHPVGFEIEKPGTWASSVVPR